MTSDARKAGQPYEAVRETRFLGTGATRSCGKCQRHRIFTAGGRVHPVRGWICADCCNPDRSPR